MRELVKGIAAKAKTIDLSGYVPLPPARKKNPGWTNIEKWNHMRTAEKLKRELEEDA